MNKIDFEMSTWNKIIIVHCPVYCQAEFYIVPCMLACYTNFEIL